MADYNKFASQTLNAKIKQKKLFDKSAFAGFISSTDLNKKVTTSAKKAELKAGQDKITKLQAFDSSYFRGKNHFEDDSTRNYLAFQAIYRYFKNIGNTDHLSSWKSKELSDESIKPPAASNNSLALAFN